MRLPRFFRSLWLLLSLLPAVVWLRTLVAGLALWAFRKVDGYDLASIELVTYERCEALENVRGHASHYLTDSSPESEELLADALSWCDKVERREIAVWTLYQLERFSDNEEKRKLVQDLERMRDGEE